LMGATLLNEDGTIYADFNKAVASIDPGLSGGKLSSIASVASAVQSDGKILVVRKRFYDRRPNVPTAVFALIRLNRDGTYDDAFWRIDLPDPDYYALAIVVQRDDRFFVLGNGVTPFEPTALSRFT